MPAIDPPEWLRWTLIAAGCLGAAIAAIYVVRSAQRLDRRIKEFRAEMDDRKEPFDPFAALAELYAEDAARRKGRRKKNSGS